MRYTILLLVFLFIGVQSCTIDAQKPVTTVTTQPVNPELERDLYGYVQLGTITYPVYCTSKNTECSLEGSMFVIREFCDGYKPDRHYLTKKEKALVKPK